MCLCAVHQTVRQSTFLTGWLTGSATGCLFDWLSSGGSLDGVDCNLLNQINVSPPAINQIKQAVNSQGLLHLQHNVSVGSGQ